MVRWRDVVSILFSRYEDLEIACSGCRESFVELSSVPSEPPEDIKMLSSCISCMVNQILEPMNIKRYYLTSPFGDVTVFVLEDAVVEVGEEGGSVVSKENAKELIEFLKELGFDTKALEQDEELLKSS